MAALKSNNERWGFKTVTLRFKRAAGAAGEGQLMAPST
jgi:hypothetical protein